MRDEANGVVASLDEAVVVLSASSLLFPTDRSAVESVGRVRIWSLLAFVRARVDAVKQMILVEDLKQYYSYSTAPASNLELRLGLVMLRNSAGSCFLICSARMVGIWSMRSYAREPSGTTSDTAPVPVVKPVSRVAATESLGKASAPCACAEFK